MNKSKTLMASAVILTVGGAAFFSVNSALAHSNSGSTIASRIANRFSLDENEVKGVFSEHQAEKRSERQAKLLEQLQARVDDGTLTPEQKVAIEAKLEEMQLTRNELHNQELTREQIHESMELLRDELKTWAEANGITLGDILPQGKAGNGHRGHDLRS